MPPLRVTLRERMVEPSKVYTDSKEAPLHPGLPSLMGCWLLADVDTPTPFSPLVCPYLATAYRREQTLAGRTGH